MKEDTPRLDHLQCCICRSKLDINNREPKLLRCLHASCENCDGVEIGEPRVFCPICSETSGERGLSPVDFTRRNEVVVTTAKACPEQLLCSNREDGNQAVGYCLDCRHFLCSKCNHAHNLLEVTKNHNSLDLSQLASIPAAEWTTRPKCQTHPEYPLVYFCRNQSCLKLVCLVCVTSDHEIHQREKIGPAYDKEKENFEHLIHKIDAQLAEIDNQNPNIFGEEGLRKDVNTVFDSLYAALDKRQQDLLDAVDDHYGSKDENDSTGDIGLLLANLQHTKSYCDKALSFTTKPELLNLIDKIRKRAEQLLKIDFPHKDGPTEDLLFKNDGLDDLIDEIQNFGKVFNDRDVEAAVKERTFPKEHQHSVENETEHKEKPTLLKALATQKTQQVSKTSNKQPQEKRHPGHQDTPCNNYDYPMSQGQKDYGRPCVPYESELDGDVPENIHQPNEAYERPDASRGPSLHETLDGYKQKEPDRNKGNLSNLFPTKELSGPGANSGAGSALAFFIAADHLRLSQDEEPASYDTMQFQIVPDMDSEKDATLYLSPKSTGIEHRVKCVHLEFDKATVYKEISITSEGRLINDLPYVQPPMTSWRFKNYKGALVTRPLDATGMSYLEFAVTVTIKQELTGRNLIFEAAIADRDVIDHSHKAEDQSTAWGVTLSNCPEHNSLCQRTWGGGKEGQHFPSTLTNTSGATANFRYGFFLSQKRRKVFIADCLLEKVLYSSAHVNTNKPLWPVFGVYNNAWVHVETAMISSTDIKLERSLAWLLLGNI